MRCSYAVGVYRKKRRKRLQSVKGLDERERERIERNGEKKILKKKNKELLASCSSRVVFFILSLWPTVGGRKFPATKTKALCVLCLLEPLEPPKCEYGR